MGSRKLAIIAKILILILGVLANEINSSKNSISANNGMLSTNKYVLVDSDTPQIPISREEKRAMKSNYPRFPAQRIRTARSRTDELMQQYMNPMMKLPELNYQYISPAVSRFNTVALSILIAPFALLSLFGDTNDFIFTQFGFISGILGFCIGILLFIGLLPDTLTLFMSVVIGAVNSYCTLKLTKVREMPHVSILFFCFLLSNLIYQLSAGIGNYALNPLYTGIGGAVLMRISKMAGYNFGNMTLFVAALKMSYILVLLALSLMIYSFLPRNLKCYGNTSLSSSGQSLLESNKNEKNDNEILMLQKYTQSISSFILTYPIIAFISQMAYVSGVFTTSPFDLISFFYIPSQLHLDYYSTHILITAWLLLAIATFIFRTKLSNRDSYQPKFVKTLIAEKWRLHESQ